MTSKGNVMKIICLGNVATGKTSLARRYVTDEFSHQYRTTIGVDFLLKEIEINNLPVRVQFWDLAGQERFTGLTRPYYRNSGGAVIVFDLTSRETWDAVLNWQNDVNSKIELPNGQKLPILLLGNKCDLLNSEKQCVSDEDIDKVVQQRGFFKFAKVSAMTGQGVQEAISELLHEVDRRLSSKNGANSSAAAPGPSTQAAKPKPSAAPAVDVSPTQPQQDEGCC